MLLEKLGTERQKSITRISTITRRDVMSESFLPTPRAFHCIGTGHAKHCQASSLFLARVLLCFFILVVRLVTAQIPVLRRNRIQ